MKDSIIIFIVIISLTIATILLDQGSKRTKVTTTIKIKFKEHSYGQSSWGLLPTVENITITIREESSVFRVEAEHALDKMT